MRKRRDVRRRRDVVPGTGLEPAGRIRAADFLHTTAFAASILLFVRWTMPWPWLAL